MNKLKGFIATTFLGGLIVILPFFIFFILVKWIIGLISSIVAPFMHLFPQNWNSFFIEAIAIGILIGLCFFMGLMIRTQFGKNFYSMIEDGILAKLPMYTTIKETVQQIFGDNKTSFQQVVLIDPYHTGTRMIGFITDELENDHYAVFVPTAPNPTNGYVYVMPKRDIEFIDAKSDKAMKAIFSLGGGMKNIVPKSTPPKNVE